MAQTFKLFNTSDDIVPGDVQTISQPIWSENINPLIANGAVGFHTSSAQVTQSGDYFVDVYHRNPDTEVNAAIQFAVAYGHRLGSGSVGDPNTLGQNINDTPSRAIYSQYRNVLLPPTDTAFTFGSDTPDDIIVLNVARSRFRQKVDPGNWELRIGSGSGIGSAASYSSFIDASNEGETPSVTEAGRVFGIYSGSGGVTSSNAVYGLFYPDLGVYVFNAHRLKTDLGMQFNSSSQVQARNHVTMSMRVSASAYFAARSEEKVSSTHYFIRVNNREFNFSNNPTFVSGSVGMFRHASMLRNPSVYITTVGLYDNSNRLLAIAKLSRPLLKSFNREALLKVKLDW